MTEKVKQIPVVEIFGPTVQGEGMTAGQRTVFVRFGLCDYRCKMCDSMHAVDPNQVRANARWLTEEQIAAEVIDILDRDNCASVTFSGGNPCIHELGDLIQELTEFGAEVSVETQGTLHPSWLHSVDYITISPKGPGMGEKFEPEKFTAFLEYLDVAYAPALCVKVVVFSALDLEFASLVYEITKDVYQERDVPFYLSLGNRWLPEDQSQPYNIAAHRAQLAADFDQVLQEITGFPALKEARILPQVHVFLYGNEKGR